jgi:CheY-like chemotaxis protein
MDSSLLLIHNDPVQVDVLSTVLAQAAPDIILAIARNTHEVSRHPIPGMILLDLDHSTPFDILKWLRYHESYRPIPVIALASATKQDEVNQAYELGANSCLLKSDGSIAAEVARGIGTYLRVLKGQTQLS